MKALVTGGTGFVGSHLVDALLAEEWEVTCAVRPTSNLRWLQDPRIRKVDSTRLGEALKGVTHVFHVAGVIQAPTQEAYMKGNRDLTRRLVEACRGRKLARFVHFSSLAAAGPSPNGVPKKEEDPCRPISKYGISKLAGEEEARKIGAPLTIVRPPVVYGPRDAGLFELFQLIANGIVPLMGARKLLSLIHVRDLIRGSLRAASAEPSTWYFTNPEPLSFHELANLMGDAWGGRRIRIYVSDGTLRALADVMAMMGLGRMFNPDKAREMSQRGWICSGDKAKRELGFVADTPPGPGFRETAAWYRHAGWI